MKRAISKALVALMTAAASAGAQRAMTVTGSVTSGGTPLVGARVRIDELKIDRMTDRMGHYSFVIPSRDVRGQTVTIIATMSDKRLRYSPSRATITLSGESLVQSFELSPATANGVTPTVAVSHDPTTGQVSGPQDSRALARRDTIDLTDVARLGTLSSALVGRFAGLHVAPASTPGGSAQFTFRGPRSALVLGQPLVVIDGLPMSNTVFTSAAQRFGFGGFDFGSSMDDLDLSSVESIRFISGAEAASAFGGRGANGVVLVTTNSGSDGPHFAIGATHVSVNGGTPRLPKLQNAYGQGLDGTFAFFDGKGGGTNDAVDQNWGPALDGRPVAQASYWESARPDVRFWLPNSDNIRSYFSDGGASATTVSIQARNDIVSLHAILADRGTDGITPSAHLGARNASLHVSFQPTSRLNVSVSGIGAEVKNENAPSTGMGESNPVFQFLRMGRQVSLDSLRQHLLDQGGNQVSWNYVDHNNPFFESLQGSNYSRRFHTAGAGSLTYALTSALRATVRGGVDTFRDGRLFTIPSGWMGGFPFFAADGNFSRGGSEGDEVFVQQNAASFRLDGIRSFATGTRWTISGGIDVEATQQRLRSAGVDSIANVPAAGASTDATIPQPVTWAQHSSTTSVFGETGFSFSNGVTLQGGVRNAWVARPFADVSTAILPNVRASLDLQRGLFARTRAIESAILRGSWWMDAPESTPYGVESLYAGGQPIGATAPSGVVLSPTIKPEVTNGFEIGPDFGFRAFGLTVSLTYYDEHTSNLILPTSASGSTVATNAGGITNQGIDTRISARLGDASHGFGWTLSANASKNSNRVDQLFHWDPCAACADGTSQLLALGPTQLGVTVTAEPGEPLGVIRGLRLLRNGAGSLVLRNGLPVADSASGAQRLGVGQPSWSFGMGNSLQYRWLSVSAQIDARIGGQVFSATNMIGTYSGTLASTEFRPDTGLLITGVDAVTGQANSQHVSAQDYYHALGSVADPWVYSASFLKLRDLRVSAAIPLATARLPFESVRASVVARNVATWTKAPNIDPEAVFSSYQLPGLEMGQLPFARSIGFEVTIVP